MSQDSLRARSVNLAELVSSIWRLDTRDFAAHFNVVNSLLLLLANRTETKDLQKQFKDFKTKYALLLSDYYADPVLLEAWSSKQKLVTKTEAINELSEIIREALELLKESGIDVWKTERGMGKLG